MNDINILIADLTSDLVNATKDHCKYINAMEYTPQTTKNELIQASLIQLNEQLQILNSTYDAVNVRPDFGDLK